MVDPGTEAGRHRGDPQPGRRRGPCGDRCGEVMKDRVHAAAHQGRTGGLLPGGVGRQAVQVPRHRGERPRHAPARPRHRVIPRRAGTSRPGSASARRVQREAQPVNRAPRPHREVPSTVPGPVPWLGPPVAGEGSEGPPVLPTRSTRPRSQDLRPARPLHPQGMRQPVRCDPGLDPPQRRPHRLRVGGLHHLPRPPARPDIRHRDKPRTGRPPPRRHRHPQPARRRGLVKHLTHRTHHETHSQHLWATRGPDSARKMPKDPF